MQEVLRRFEAMLRADYMEPVVPANGVAPAKQVDV